MDYRKYKQQSERTFAYLENPISKEIGDILHCVIGLNTEIGELDDVFELEHQNLLSHMYKENNVEEEIGDIFWYSANLDRLLGVERNSIKLDETFVTYESSQLNVKMIKYMKHLSNVIMLDNMKKVIFYQKDINDIKSILIDTNHKLQKLLLKFIVIYLPDCELETVFDTNIEKLKKRFPNKFSSEKALNRNIKEEMKVFKR